MTTVVSREPYAYAYDAALAPRASVEPGAQVIFETGDARASALLAHPPGASFELPPAPPAGANPLTGPLAVAGTRPGDRLVVTVEAIELDPAGFCGGFAEDAPAALRPCARPFGRVCAVEDGRGAFSDAIGVVAAPMVGCAGTAADGAPASLLAGRFGGNLDHPPLAAGARLHLPVQVPEALLFIGDVHAAQGDGELSGFGLEIGAHVTVTVDRESEGAIAWPWLETADRIMVLTAGESFEAARDAAVECAVFALRTQRGLEVSEALALISLVGDLRLGQAYGGPQVTVRLELPRSLGLQPQ